jgi:hypothetical protein
MGAWCPGVPQFPGLVGDTPHFPNLRKQKMFFIFTFIFKGHKNPSTFTYREGVLAAAQLGDAVC